MVRPPPTTPTTQKTQVRYTVDNMFYHSWIGIYIYIYI